MGVVTPHFERKFNSYHFFFFSLFPFSGNVLKQDIAPLRVAVEHLNAQG